MTQSTRAFLAALAASSLALFACSAAALAPAREPGLQGSAPGANPSRLLRFPDVHGEQLVFCYAGDLWTAPTAGGQAERLTAHPGLELFPKFSPDGRWIAFTGQYDGDEQVYVIPSSGGIPRQLTWYPARGPLPPRWGYDHQIHGWTGDSKAVLFRSMRAGWALTDTRLYTVPLEGGPAEPLPMPVAGAGDYSPDGTRVVYSPLTRDFRTWKRYQGGWAQDLYVYELASAALKPVAHSPRTERDPMWIGTKIAFASDRDGTLNLYSFDTASGAVAQLTRSTSWDVRWPSRGEAGEIVYELGGDLWLLDTRQGSARQVPIEVPNDGVAMRPARIAVADRIEGFALSPKGERALVVARGDVFTLPIEKGPTRNLTRSSGAHDRSARWSPDGKRVLYISDASGEEELWLVAQDGSGEPEQLTRGNAARIRSCSWSPDGERVAFDDKNGRLFVVELASKQQQEIARDRGGRLQDASWAPDSAHLAFSLSSPSGSRSIAIWSRADQSVRVVHDELFSEYEPVWDPAGKYLYYLSDRDYAPQLSGAEWNFATNRTTGVFALALRADVPHPLPPESDEVAGASEPTPSSPSSSAPADGAASSPASAPASAPATSPAQREPLRIDYEGLAKRVARLPIAADNYAGLEATDGHLFCIKSPAPYYGRDGEGDPALLVFAFSDRKLSTLLEDVGGYALSQDGKKLLARQGGALGLYDASPKGKDSKKAVSTAGMIAERVPQEEWEQIFHETWRRFRDFFYVENMHGYDWDALRKQYAAQLTSVAHRADLNYVLGEMIAELNVSHAYVAGGDYQIPPRPPVALMGARLELDRAAGRQRIAQIFRGHNEEEIYRSPLTEIGVDAKVGDYVLAVDGEELRANDDVYRLLVGKADRPVELTLNATPSFEGARKVRYVPIRSESDLMYLDWVESCRAKVDAATGGRVAYLHLPNMGAEGIREFVKWFYGQVRREGLIIDVRANGGGNVSAMVLERLRRVLSATEFSRNSEYTGTYPNELVHGPMVCLLDENSASDGDIFPWMFRASGLGPLIGKRSWGGVVGITSHGPLIDGGQVSVPEFGHADAQGQWAVEGHGVDPDIVVENDPKSLIEGRDPQLERAIAEVLARMEQQGKRLPPRPADPVKTK